MNNKKHIELIEKKIQLAEEYANYLEEKNMELYKLDSLDNFIPNDYKIREKIEDLEYIKEVLERLTEKGIDVGEKYKITDNTYLSISVRHNIEMYAGVDDEMEGFLYNYYIGSHSGIHEWFEEVLAEAYDLYSGNSDYNFALGTMSLKEHFRNVENKPKDDYSKRPHSAETVADEIESIINFFKEKNNKIRKAIVKDIDFKFKLLKELIKKGEEE